MSNWKKQLFKKGEVFFDENKIAKFPIKKNLGIEFHESKPNGANLRELSSSLEMTQTNWEYPDYLEILKEYIGKERDGVCADLGCGDGRFVKCLLDIGFTKIIAVESHYNSLVSLSKYLSEINAHDKVLLVNSSIESLPFKDEVLDSFIAINVFYYLNEKQIIALEEAYRVIKKEGVAISTYHNYEALLLRALVFNGIEDFFNILDKGNYREVKDENSPFRFNTEKPESEEGKYKEVGFEVCDSRGISLFHQFLNYKQKEVSNGHKFLMENREILYSFFDYLSSNSQLHKTKVIKIKK